MNDIEIIDNFLEPSVFENLKNQMYSQQMVWSYGRMLSSEHCEILCDELDNSLMYHIMYESESSLFNFVDISDLTFSTATITARGCMIYNDTNSDKAVATIDFGGDKTSTAGDFTIVFPAKAASTAIIRIA